MNLMKAESPGPQVDKLVPKVQSTAKILYGIYLGLTVIEIIFLLIGHMPLFHSVQPEPVVLVLRMTASQVIPIIYRMSSQSL